MNLAGYQNSQLGFSAFSKWGERKKQEAIEKARQKELRKREEEAKREAEAKKDKFHTNLLSTAQELIKPITGGHMLKPKIVGERTIEILNKKTLEQEHLEQLERERPQFPTYFKDVKTIQEIIDRFYALEKSDNIQHLDSGIAMLVGATSEGSLFQKELKPALKELRERLLERRKKILNPTPAPAPTPAPTPAPVQEPTPEPAKTEGEKSFTEKYLTTQNMIIGGVVLGIIYLATKK